MPSSSPGVVYLVGAGPGDPALLTRRGAELLARAEVVLYDGLVNASLLDLAPPACERIYAGKKRSRHGAALTQDDINARLVERARAGKLVVRLKGGDPFVFGRGAEECLALDAAEIPFEVVPGVSSALAVTAYAGIPLTARGVSSTVAFATGHEAAGKPDSDVDWQALAHAGTVVLFMALRTARDCADHLIAAGRDPETPAAAIYWGTTAAQRTVCAPLRSLADAVDDAGLVPPVLLVIGDVVKLRDRVAWYERRPLFGRRVLVTRSVVRAQSFAHALAELGAEPIITPVTRIVAPDSDDARVVERMLSRVSDYDWIVFTSANAVWRFFDELGARRVDARQLSRARIACVGRSTQAALEDAGLFADVVPAQRRDAAGVARVVIDASGGDMAGARVLVPRAASGRDEVLAVLREAGAQVDLAPIYRTEAVDAADPAIAYGVSLLRRRSVHVAAFFAPSQVRALFAALGDEAPELVGACSIVAAVGSSTRAALERAGATVHLVSSSPDARVFAREIAAAIRAPHKES